MSIMQVLVQCERQVVLCCHSRPETDGKIIWSDIHPIYMDQNVEYPYVFGEKVMDVKTGITGKVISITRFHGADGRDSMSVMLTPQRIFIDYLAYLELFGHEDFVNPSSIKEWPKNWDEWKEINSEVGSFKMPNEDIRY